MIVSRETVPHKARHVRGPSSETARPLEGTGREANHQGKSSRLIVFFVVFSLVEIVVIVIVVEIIIVVEVFFVVEVIIEVFEVVVFLVEIVEIVTAAEIVVFEIFVLVAAEAPLVFVIGHTRGEQGPQPDGRKEIRGEGFLFDSQHSAHGVTTSDSSRMIVNSGDTSSEGRSAPPIPQSVATRPAVRNYATGQLTTIREMG
jgi:hypothetical protein